MDNKKSFFGESGLTSTSANHVANLAKEFTRDLQVKLNSIRFYDESIGLLTSDTNKQIRRGLISKDLDLLPDILSLISDANSLIAFLREAIKEKDRLTKEAQSFVEEEKLADWSKEFALLNQPVKESIPTFDDIMSEWSIGDQERYLSLEAKASVLGKFIHEDGAFNKARVDLSDKFNNPMSVEVNGADTIIHTYTPTVSMSDVDEAFFALQRSYRSVQTELNSMKKSLCDELESKKLSIQHKYNAEMRQYDEKYAEFLKRKHEIEEDQEKTRTKLLEHVQSLKIVIPKRLQHVYELVTNR